MDHIIVDGIKCYAHIGVPSKERLEKQLLIIDLKVEVDLAEAARLDDFQRTIDYELLVQAARRTVESKQYSLVETVAERICTRILTDFPVQRAQVRVRKYPKTLRDQVDTVGVIFTRSQGSAKQSSDF